MKAKIIDGKSIAARIREGISKSVDDMQEKYSRVPGLAVILWNNDPASRIYVNNKIKACREVSMHSQVHEFSQDATLSEVVDCIQMLNDDDCIHGILMQLPIIDRTLEKTVLEAIAFDKDVDGLHPVNAGNLLLGNKSYLPCTPQGIMTLLDNADVPIEGQHAVIVGRSNIVGKPVSLMLLQRNATVTVCHSKTRNLSEITATGDILVAAVGRPNFITKDMIKPGAAVIDVGINRIGKQVVGDVDFENAATVAGTITPVPGGVGPLTIAMLLKNTYESAKEKITDKQV